LEREPLISVVTPFYNTAAYLAECIESVLAQRYANFEYLLVDNRSTDGSADIAARYARQDRRIRLVQNETFVGQVENYNGALARISAESRYVKMVQADDALMPECLSRMVEIAERDPRIGLVSSFYLKGDLPSGEGIPRGISQMNGREVCRRMLLTECFPIGSPTSVLYRADLVRARAPFYALGRYHEDTEAAYELLLEHDLGFVHQVLSFLRTDNESIMSRARRFNPAPLDHLILLERYGPQVLTPEELARQRAGEWRAYLGFLGSSLLARREKAFWDYHQRGLASIDRKVSRLGLLPYALKALVRRVLNPLDTIRGGLAAWRRSRRA
jgi:glycosyltransferase involved in cell wall biosynthesis